MDRSPAETTRGAGLAEALGTFVFVLVGAGVICVERAPGGSIGLLGVALANGFALCAMIYALRGYSLAHLNPAATLAALLLGRITPKVAGQHFLAQLSGAALAGIALRALFPAALEGIHLGTPVLADGLTFGRAIAAEAVVAFAWVLTLGATEWRGSHSEVGPLAVGLVYTTAILVLGPLTGAAGNPARAFGPAFAAGSYGDQTVYWIGPLIGGLIAALVYWLVLRQPAETAAPAQLDPPAPSATPDARSLYRRGILLFKAGHLEEAAQYLDRVTQMQPEWPEPYYYIGMVYREYGDEVNANAFFDAALYYRGAHLERRGDDRIGR